MQIYVEPAQLSGLIPCQSLTSLVWDSFQTIGHIDFTEPKQKTMTSHKTLTPCSTKSGKIIPIPYQINNWRNMFFLLISFFCFVKGLYVWYLFSRLYAVADRLLGITWYFWAFIVVLAVIFISEWLLFPSWNRWTLTFYSIRLPHRALEVGGGGRHFIKKNFFGGKVFPNLLTNPPTSRFLWDLGTWKMNLCQKRRFSGWFGEVWTWFGNQQTPYPPIFWKSFPLFWGGLAFPNIQVKSLHKGQMGEGGLFGRVSGSTNMFLVDGLARWVSCGSG